MDLRDLRCAERCRRQISPVNAFPSLQTLQDEVAAFRIVRRALPLHMVVPERIFQRDQLRLIGIIPVQMPDDGLVFVVSIQAAEVDPVQIHDRHIMPSLRFIVQRNDLLAVVPPVLSGIIICRLDLQNGIAAVRKLHKVVQIRQHPRIQRVLEHDLPLKDTQPGFLCEDPCDQVFQQMPHLQRDPVLIHVCLYNVQLVIVQIPRCPPGRNAKDRRSVAAADAPPPAGQPFFVAQTACVYQFLRLILQPQHHSFLPSSIPAAVPHASAREPLCDDTPQIAAAVLRDAISFLFSFGYRLS